MEKIFIVFLITTFSITVNAQLLTKDDLRGAEFTRIDNYNKTALWGYIDGGADIYLEYGFKSVQVYEFTIDSIALHIDTYEMTDLDAAYGVFSVSTIGWQPESTKTAFDCYSEYEHRFCQANYYVMISSDRTDERARRLRFEFAELLKTRIEKSAATISSIYADTALSKYHPQIILCRGILGIQNGTPELENLFENSDLQKGLRLVAVELTIDKSKINLFFVTYDENVNRRTELLGEQFNISSSSGIKWETKLVTSPSQTSRLVFYEPKPEAQIEFLINRIMQCLN